MRAIAATISVTRRRVLTAQLSAPVRRFLSTETGSTGLLLGAAVLALVWANSAWSAAYEALWGTVGAISLGGAELSMDLGTGSTTG